MKSFFQEFLREPLGKQQGNRRASAVEFAVFGKHPGWADHFGPLGGKSPSVNRLREALYINGISQNLDSGAWEALDPEGGRPEFNHQFVWIREDKFLAGVVRPSRDSKGRDLFPVICVAHCVGVDPEAVLRGLFPSLERAADILLETTDTERVGQIISSVQNQLEVDVLGPSTPGQETGGADLSEEDAERIARALHRILRTMRAYGPSDGTLTSSTPGARSLRLSLSGGQRENDLFTWLRLLRTQVQTASPILAIMPKEGAWVDVILGEPTAEELMCLCAGTKSIPCADLFNFEIDPSIREWAQLIMESFIKNGARTPNIFELENEAERRRPSREPDRKRPKTFSQMVQNLFKDLKN